MHCSVRSRAGRSCSQTGKLLHFNGAATASAAVVQPCFEPSWDTRSSHGPSTLSLAANYQFVPASQSGTFRCNIQINSNTDVSERMLSKTERPCRRASRWMSILPGQHKQPGKNKAETSSRSTADFSLLPDSRMKTHDALRQMKDVSF